MSRIEEELTRLFREWELRGRGWQTFPEPVTPEPPFRPFRGHYLPDAPIEDDGRRPTILSSLFGKLREAIAPEPQQEEPVLEEETEPESLIRDPLVELHISLPANLNIGKDVFEQFLLNLSLLREPVTFELVGRFQRVITQFAVHPDDAFIIEQQFQAHFPEAVIQRHEAMLETAWEQCNSNEALVVEFGLAEEFMLPLALTKLDPYVGLIGALSQLKAQELGLFQIIFQPVSHPWEESIVNSVTHADGKPFFVNRPELAGAAERKVSRPLFAAVVRIAVGSESFDRTLQISRDLAASLRVFAHPQGNELIPLENADYPFEEHLEDTFRRQSRRSGMILSADELMGFVHLPSSSVRSSALEREGERTKAAPTGEPEGLLLGTNYHAGKSNRVHLSREQRVRHMHIVGASGTGKSTLIFNLIRQDIENGEGIAVLDPHGDLIDRIIGIIPPERVGDVVLVDPSDEQFSVGFNILSAHSDLEKNLLASDLVSVFQRLSTSWGDQMGSVLQNAILAFLESEQGGTLADLQRFLIEPAYRDKFLKTVRDPDIVYYWRKAFMQLSGNKSIGSVLTRLGTFLSPKPIRYMVSQPVNRLDFGQILDTGKIFLAKLPQGQMGKENAFLLGSLLVAKFQQLAMGRQSQQAAARKDFWLYIDEFQNFITPSMAEILSGARKYRLGLILAHQELRQLERDREVASAVLSNPYTRVVFRVGDSDARALESGFSLFEASDLQNLETGQAICRIEKADGDFNLSIPFSEEIAQEQEEATRQMVIAASRSKYATPRAEIEAALLAKLNEDDAVLEPPKPKPASPPLPKHSEAKAAEVQKPTISEKEILASSMSAEAKPEPVSEVSVKSIKENLEVLQPSITEIETTQPVPSDRGIGGHQHNLIRERIEVTARQLGFYAAREKLTATGQKIDLSRYAKVI